MAAGKDPSLRFGMTGEAGHTLNELPQPQEEVAFGFFTWKEAPTISST